ncbi:MAG: hypothetical protein HWN67_04015 [Candidatus Helarchaeota archaeon]|nr:hypothetical protein [Candidatus Helarchaeota archaeon]
MKPYHCIILGISFNIVGVFIIIIGPNFRYDLVVLLEKLVTPLLFYWPYLIAGGTTIICGVFLVILGVVTKLLGIEEWHRNWIKYKGRNSRIDN